MTKKYLFSIIIPTFNRAERLDVGLASLVEQHFKDFEVIVSDDGSTDHTDKVVAKYKDSLNLKYIVNENWGGPARPRNIAIQAAQGEWLCFLDSDDWCIPEKLTVLSNHLLEFDFIYHDLMVYNESGYTGKSKVCRHLGDNPFIDLLVNRNGICNSGVTVKKTLVDKVGGFSEDRRMIAIEDYDLWVRIAKETNRFLYLPLALGIYYTGGNNISANYLHRNEIEVYAFNKHQHLIPQNLMKKALVKLNVSLAINYIMANKIDYIKCLCMVFLNGSLRERCWALFNLPFGFIYIKWYVKRLSLNS